MAELLVFLQFGRNLCAASCEIVRSEVCNIVHKGLQICFVLVVEDNHLNLVLLAILLDL